MQKEKKAKVETEHHKGTSRRDKGEVIGYTRVFYPWGEEKEEQKHEGGLISKKGNEGRTRGGERLGESHVRSCTWIIKGGGSRY